MEVFILYKKDIKINSSIIISYIYYKKFKKLLDFSFILKDKNDKPYLKNNEFFFNISHCKSYICIAIGSSPVGIDIEEERHIKKNAIDKFLTKEEQNSKISPLQYWVIKEAYSKYVGYGLRMDFKTISIKNIKKSLILHNLSSEHYICYAVSKNKLKNIEILRLNDLLNFIKAYNLRSFYEY